MQRPWVKLKETVDRDDVTLINALAAECIRFDDTALKLELDYKLGVAAECISRGAMRAVNELMYFDGEKLVGYIGIGNFGGAGSPPEVMGMVHPEYRRQGVFQTLSSLVIDECKRQSIKSILLLCGRQSDAGQAFIAKMGAHLNHSEYEMYLRRGDTILNPGTFLDIAFKKAINADAKEVARQNAIYFGDERNMDADHSVQEGDAGHGLLMPEEEERKGMTIYFAVYGEQVIGKVHLQLISGVGGIYGLGVLPEYRGRGLGRAILLRAVEKLKELGAKEVMLQVVTENANALHLYESCGFQVTSTMDYYELTI